MARRIESENFLVDDTSGFARVFFSKNFYDKRILFEVCDEFSEHIYMLIDENDASFEVTFISKDQKMPVSEIVFEFSNYLLGITVSKLKVN